MLEVHIEWQLPRFTECEHDHFSENIYTQKNANFSSELFFFFLIVLM